MCQQVPQIQRVVIQSEGQFPKVSWKAECEAQVCATHSEPILLTAGLPWISIPEFMNIYAFEEKSVPRHFLVYVLRQKNMPIFVIVVHVFVRILNLVRIMGHLNLNVYIIIQFFKINNSRL